MLTRILYVEDNDDNVYMLKTRLELLDDFEVLVAEDGETGCAMAAADKPDLIMMDLELPVVDGWEAMRRLRHDPTTCDIPIIALSAHALTGSREKALAAGCDEFDTKPVDFDRLVATIRRILTRSAASCRPAAADCMHRPPPASPTAAEEIGMRVAEACP